MGKAEETKAEKEAAVKTAKRDIEEVNAKMICLAAATAVKYDDPVVSGPYDAVRLAKRLAKKFPTIAFTIAVGADFSPVIYGKPFYKAALVDEKEDYYLPNKAQTLLALLAKADSYFPTFERVQAYAEGCAHAEETEREVADLKKKLEELKSSEREGGGYGGGFYGPPCMMMMRRRGMF